jgi:hypothetical protein
MNAVRILVATVPFHCIAERILTKALFVGCKIGRVTKEAEKRDERKTGTVVYI